MASEQHVNSVLLQVICAEHLVEVVFLHRGFGVVYSCVR
uniref:Uncharacterized protein n=1 Tax=Arundo donax TaxID=35708 RepID=A0A0A9CJ15_ARUDO